MLAGFHILLTYECTLACDHCFLYSSPRASGAMTLAQVREVLEASQRVGTIERIYFEGGEPFLCGCGARGGRGQGPTRHRRRCDVSGESG